MASKGRRAGFVAGPRLLWQNECMSESAGQRTVARSRAGTVVYAVAALLLYEVLRTL